MPEEQAATQSETLALTAEIVAAHLSNNALSGAEVPALIQAVFETLEALARDEAPVPAVLVPAVPIRRSITEDYIVCLEDGKKLKTLRRHLQSAYGLTPEQYRAKWGLPHDYPMVAPNYSRRRRELAKEIGLGRKRAGTPAPKRRAGPGRGKAQAA